MTAPLGNVAMATNNVEVAFGTDENGNGVLDLEEIDLTIGWDAGKWRVERNFSEVASDVGVDVFRQTLLWEVGVDANGTPTRLAGWGVSQTQSEEEVVA